MTAKIIELKDYRSSVQHRVNGIPFPQIYRVTGMFFDFDVLNESCVPSDRVAPFCFTLDESDQAGLARVQHQAIHCFDPAIDNGWLVVRHHMSEALLEGYLDAIMDQRSSDESRTSRAVFRTDKGLFTLMHRPATPGCPNNLIVYVTKVIANNDGLSWVDRHHIVLSDGSTSEDSDMLYADDETV